MRFQRCDIDDSDDDGPENIYRFVEDPRVLLRQRDTGELHLTLNGRPLPCAFQSLEEAVDRVRKWWVRNPSGVFLRLLHAMDRAEPATACAIVYRILEGDHYALLAFLDRAEELGCPFSRQAVLEQLDRFGISPASRPVQLLEEPAPALTVDQAISILEDIRTLRGGETPLLMADDEPVCSILDCDAFVTVTDRHPSPDDESLNFWERR